MIVIICVVGISISIIIAGDGGLHDFFHFFGMIFGVDGFAAGDL